MILINNIYNKLRNNAGVLYPYLLVFIAAFALRFIAWKIFGTLFNAKDGDSIEYYITSINFEPHNLFKAMWGYEHWYERTPAYTVFLHIVNRELIYQIILSSIGCALMYRLHKTAGLLWIFYLQDIIYSFNYTKECLLLFCIILAIYLLRKKRKWLVLLIPIVFSGFVSYGGVITSSHAYSHGFMLNFWKLWQPSFNISIGYGKIFVFLQALPYTLMIIYFIRNTKILSVEAAIFIFLSLLYSSIYAEPRYREPFMPLLFLFCAPAVENAYYRLRNIIFNKQKFDFKGIFKKYILNPSS